MTVKNRPTAPNISNSDNQEINGAVQKCSLQVEIRIVKIAEICTNDQKLIATTKGRRQYINLARIEGYPEYGRELTFKVLIELVNQDESCSLAGKKIYWYYKAYNENNEELPGNGYNNEGFNGRSHITSMSLSDGWTTQVKFILSKNGGDKFDIFATTDASLKGGIKTGTYTVWRKFWYQITHDASTKIPHPAKSVKAYAKVYAEMVESSIRRQYNEADSPSGTYYPRWMVKGGKSTDKVALIGGHNREHFYGKFKDLNSEPVKGHLIICSGQWDPARVDKLGVISKKDIKTNPTGELEVTVENNAGILKPSLNGNLVIFGQWRSEGGRWGLLTDDNIIIDKDRTKINCIKILLPKDAPDPAKEIVNIFVKLNYGKYYAGESNGKQMLIVYDGYDSNFTQVVSHEFGHGFGQVPRPVSHNDISFNHPNQYDNAYGGQGSHCSTGAKLIADERTTSGMSYRQDSGTCIMFHVANSKGQEFCQHCAPFVKSQDFSELK